jgi:hypothetical protein
VGGGDQVVTRTVRLVAGVFGALQLGQGLLGGDLGDGGPLLGFGRDPGGLASRPDRLVARGLGGVDVGPSGPMGGRNLDGRGVGVRRGPTAAVICPASTSN